MSSEPKKRLHFGVRTLLIVIAAFALGLMTRDIIDRHKLPRSSSLARPGDRLIVTSRSDSSLNCQVTVMLDHTITLPLVPAVSVKGLTTEQIQKKLDNVYGKLYKAPAMKVAFADTYSPATTR